MTVSIVSTSLTLDLDTDESYTVECGSEVNSGPIKVKIRAHTFFGARHALETVGQAITYDDYTKRLQVKK